MTRTLRHAVEYGFIRLVRGLDRVLGARWTGALAAGLGRLAYRPFRVRAELVEAHLRQAFPGRDPRWIRRTAAASYAHLAREGLAMLRLSRSASSDRTAGAVVFPPLDELRESVEAGTGIVMVTGHIGNWEIAGAALAARGIPIDAVVSTQSNPYFDRMITRARERVGIRIIRRGDATRRSLEALRAGRMLVLVADQDARAAGVFVPFLGRPASTHRGPAVLALRAGAPLFVGAAIRAGDGGYEGWFKRIPHPPPGDFDDRVLALTAAYTRALEAAVRAHPTQYFWHHRRWKTPPPAGNDPAADEVPVATESEPGNGG